MYIEDRAVMHLKGTSMGTKVIFIALITLIATAGFLLIKSDTPIEIAGQTLGTEPAPKRQYKAQKESTPTITKVSEDSKSQK